MNVPARVDLPSRSEFDHPAWTVGVATVVSYGLALLGMALLLFVVPFLLFLAL